MPVGNAHAQQGKGKESQTQENEVGKVHLQMVLCEKGDEEDEQSELEFAEEGAERGFQNGEAASQPPRDAGGDKNQEFHLMGVEESGGQRKPGFRRRSRDNKNPETYQNPENKKKADPVQTKKKFPAPVSVMEE
jgi:hypothetical protein